MNNFAIVAQRFFNEGEKSRKAKIEKMSLISYIIGD